MNGISLDIDETLAFTVKYWIENLQELFGNPENLSSLEMIEKYTYVQNVPYWQSIKAQEWIIEKIYCNETQKILPLIPNALEYVNKINEIIPISAYITARPESIREGTQYWLNKHKFPKAPLILKPNEISFKKSSKWKADLLYSLYPQILGIIDDNKSVANNLPKNYQGNFFIFKKWS